ncbi:MAG: alpha/beta fold hydrolase [Gemmatimonadota bacterium]
MIRSIIGPAGVACAATLASACANGGFSSVVEAERRVQRSSIEVTETEAVRVVRPGGRTDGAGDCRAVVRAAAAGERLTADERLLAERCAAGSAEAEHARPAAASIDWRPFLIRLTNGQEVNAESATVVVPENRADPASPPLALAVFRLRGARAEGRPPLLFLDGAPDTGPSSTTLRYPELMSFFEALRESRDVVFMDYRGSGRSGALECLASRGMPANTFETREAGLAFFAAQARSCAGALRRAGRDLTGYTWRAVAADVADLRASLGVPKIDLLGFSSGTHAALVTLREHPEIVSRVVLIGSEGPDHTRKLPLAADRQLAKISDAMRAAEPVGSSRSDFAATVERALRRADEAPFVVAVENVDGDSVRIEVGRYALSYLATGNMSGPGEFRLLVPLFLTLDRGDVSVLTQIIQRFAGAPSVLSAATYLMDGASGISPEREHRLREQATVSIFSDASSFPYPEIEAAWGIARLDDAYRSPVRSEAPALFITGEFDGNTPPEQASQLAAGFPNSSELVVANAGHAEPIRMTSVAATIAEFLDGENVAQRRLSAEPIRFPSGF